MSFDISYMKMALSLAEKGVGYTSPNPVVGAVVVKDGKVVGKGWHQQAGGEHAEVIAIDAAGEYAKGSTLYVTLEPCNHEGRTPPCTRKILDNGIERVVFAMSDPNPNVKGGGGDFLLTENIDVVSGVCEDESLKLNESFIKHSLTNRPFVTLKCAATLDGQIATRTGDSKWITNNLSRKYVHQLRHGVDAVMVGIGTILVDNPSLNVRLDDFDGRDPIRIVLDAKLSIDEDAKIINLDSHAHTIIASGHSCSEKKKRILEKKGAEIIKLDEQNGLVDLDALMNALGEKGITSILIEGGSRVSASAICAGVVDKICFFYAPKILGGDDGVPILRGPGPEVVDQGIKIKDTRVKLFDEDVMIEGYIDRSCLRE